MSGNELQLERKKASFPVRELTFLLDGGRDVTDKKEFVRKFIDPNDPAFYLRDWSFLDRTAKYKKGLQINYKLLQLLNKNPTNWSRDEFKEYLRRSIPIPLPTDMHELAFLPYVKAQLNDEQLKYWIPLAESYKVIGAYAQTELGRGSNIMKLETTATFIKETDEFELNTPTLTATKWWPGTLGCTANHAIVLAQMIIGDTNHGLHPFIVPLRSMKDHKALPGVTIGDIGPKMGLNSYDNGFLKLDRVRIPRTNLPMRYFQVDRDGNYTKPAHAKLAYTGMINIRAKLVSSAGEMVARAAVIAVRYSAVRRQFGEDPETGLEKQVLDYRTQQYRILPHLATAYALKFTGFHMLKIYNELMEGMSKGVLDTLPEVHATSAGLKSLTTRMAAEGIESCRLACGGHGYSSMSGLPDGYVDYVGTLTAEGENYLLTQQTTRYLLKVYDKSQQSGVAPAGFAKYLERDYVSDLFSENCPAHTEEDFLNPHLQLRAYERRAARLVANTAAQLREAVEGGKNPMHAWNDSLVEIYRCSKAHCLCSIVFSFIKAVEEVKSNNPRLYPVLTKLCNLFVLYRMEEDIGEFLDDGYLNTAQAAMIRKQVRNLLVEVRPESVALADAFNFSDYWLNSAIGGYDGKVYETMYEWVKHSPFNKSEVPPGYEEYLKPLITAKL